MNVRPARFIGSVMLAITGLCSNVQAGTPWWSDAEIATLQSLWIGSLPPLESAAEHGGTRLQYAHLIAGDEAYCTAL